MLPLYQGFLSRCEKVIKGGPVLTANFEDVPEISIRDERRDRSPALDDGIGSCGHPVIDSLNLASI